MKAEDVTATLDLALAASGCDSATVVAKPRLLSDNGSSYIAGDLADYIEDKGMQHIRGAPYHPQTQGKIPLVTLLRNALPGSGAVAPDREEPCPARALLPAQ
jgi:transposase InsO family protein